ncbi:MAG: hypothetical protein AAGF12_36915 [Myxococcota bacterium]
MGDEPSPQDERTFTQQEVDSIVRKRLSKLPTREEYEALVSEVETLRQERDALQETNSSREREETAQLHSRIDVLEKALEERDSELESERIARTFGDALDRHNVLNHARSDAMTLLMRELRDVCKDEGGGVRATWGEVEADADTIAEAFLKSRPHLVAAVGRGAGSRGGGVPAPRTVNLEDLSAQDLLDGAGPPPE